jgi:ABC-2 type transport system ATP-binding protein
MIEVKNLTKRYGDFTAVDRLTFQIEKGKIYGLLGSNGAGKSTTMNMITGCLAATAGEIRIGGFDMLKEPEKAKRLIGYLPENPPLYTDMTPYEYLVFVAEAKGMKHAKAERQAEQAMKLTNLTDVQDRLIGNLSKGYRQRVGIAQAMLGNPDVIILDEPTVGLDPKQIIEIRDLIRRLGEVKTVILSSHILAEIRAVCDHILVISRGRLVASDTIDGLEEMYNRNAAITLEIKGDVTDVVRILKTVAGIQSFTPLKGKAPGTVEVLLYAENGKDPREEIFLAFAEERIPILKMDIRTLSLEDIFLALTKDERPSIDSESDPKGGASV